MLTCSYWCFINDVFRRVIVLKMMFLWCGVCFFIFIGVNVVKLYVCNFNNFLCNVGDCFVNVCCCVMVTRVANYAYIASCDVCFVIVFMGIVVCVFFRVNVGMFNVCSYVNDVVNWLSKSMCVRYKYCGISYFFIKFFSSSDSRFRAYVFYVLFFVLCVVVFRKGVVCVFLIFGLVIVVCMNVYSVVMFVYATANAFSSFRAFRVVVFSVL